MKHEALVTGISHRGGTWHVRCQCGYATSTTSRASALRSLTEHVEYETRTDEEVVADILEGMAQR